MAKFCSNCGAQSNGGNFCSNCGFKFSGGSSIGAGSDASIDEINSFFADFAEQETFTQFDYEKRTDGSYIIRKLKDKYATSVTIPNGTVVISEGAFRNTSVIQVKLPQGLRIIDDRAFENCKHLKSINIPSSVVLVGEEAFANCEKLDVTFPAGAEIGDNAMAGTRKEILKKEAEEEAKLLELFKVERLSDGTYAIAGVNDVSITSVKIPKCVSVIKKNAFGSWNEYNSCKSLKDIVFQDGLVTIESDSFLNCPEIRSLSFPKTLKNLAGNAFHSPYNVIQRISVDPANPVLYSKDNCIIDRNTKTLVMGCDSSLIPTDGSVTSIGDFAFYYCKGLTSVQLPECISTIGNNVFWGCENLRSIRLPSRLRKLGEGAFAHSHIDSITFPSTLREIGKYTFFLATVSKVVIPGSIAVVPSYCFSQGSFGSIILEEGVLEIETNAFDMCKYISNIQLPNSLTTIQPAAFNSCHLSKLVIPKGVKKIQGMIYQLGSINEFVIENGVTEITGGLFYYMEERVSNLYIPKSVTKIDKINFGMNAHTQIYCEHSSKPAGWSSNWCPSNVTVHWGVKHK